MTEQIATGTTVTAMRSRGMRKRADRLGPGGVIICKGPATDGSETAWYRVESVETEGSYVYALGNSDVCDDDMPMMPQGAQMVEVA